MRHVLPPLPYSLSALVPMMSAETLEFHYGKHHKGYVDQLNQLIQGTEYENLPLEDVIRRSDAEIFNNAAQVWNHTFFWNSMSPKRSHAQGNLSAALERDFGSVDGFFEEFKKRATDHFGSGYVWLLSTGAEGKLLIETTANAENPLRTSHTPLLTCDLWEHAYYIDYRNERARFIDAFFRLANWEFAERNYSGLGEIAA